MVREAIRDLGHKKEKGKIARLLVVLGACALAIGIVPILAVFIDQWRRSVEERMWERRTELGNDIWIARRISRREFLGVAAAGAGAFLGARRRRPGRWFRVARSR